jgi:Notch-like protein
LIRRIREARSQEKRRQSIIQEDLKVTVSDKEEVTSSVIIHGELAEEIKGTSGDWTQSGNTENLENSSMKVVRATERLKKLVNYTNKMKATWDIIKSETNRLKDHTINKYQNSPDTFNNHFLSTAERIMQGIRYSNTEGTSDDKNSTYYLSKISHNPFPNIKCNNTSSREIERIINFIRLKSSHVYVPSYTRSPLNYICNKSIRSGTFPTCLKYFIVKPLFKEGDRENMANYRPISLLTSFYKVFEKMIYERLLQHIKDNNILAEEQFGCRPSTSTDNALYG